MQKQNKAKTKMAVLTQRRLEWIITLWKHVLWSGKTIFQILLFGRYGQHVLQIKDKKFTCPEKLIKHFFFNVCSHIITLLNDSGCDQLQIQRLGSVMVWGCISVLYKGNLQLCDYRINAEEHIEFSEQNMLPSKMTSLFWDIRAFFIETKQN